MSEPRSAEPVRWWAPWALPVTAPPARDVLVTVEGGRITALEAKVSRARAAELGAELHDGCVVAPGFVDAHAHLEYASYDALVDGLGFAEWIGDHIHRKRRLAPAHARASAELGALTALHAGITCVGDASFSGDAAHAMHAAGLRGRVYLEVFGGVDDASAGAALEAVLARLDELPSSDLLSHGLSPHAPYTVGEPLYRRVAASGLPWMTHLLESADELAFLAGGGALHAALERTGLPLPQWDGRDPVAALADVLGPEVVAVHLTQAGPAQLEVLADTGAALAHCPRSNARLGCGRLDLAVADRAGVLVGLGTDSPASAGPLDPFAELRCALEVHRVAARDSSWPSLAHLLRMATLDAARALGYDDLGSLDVGHHADLVAVHVGACDDPLAAYVLGAGPADVRAVLVAGRDAGVRDRTSLERARARASDARQLLALPVRRETAGAGA
ncbi:MAG: amidohydrolase [Thermoleophilia bacterium]|nr:amidohydrolase [Thermoleophilia bacterium]